MEFANGDGGNRRDGGGGCNRQALTEDDRQGRNLFCDWCRAAGLNIRIDEMGNIFARRDGIAAASNPILVGSHLDTQPTGGKFDGVYGVLAGLEVVRTLNDAGAVTHHPIDIVVWTNEEGTRFTPAMNGSGVWAGKIDKQDALQQTAIDNKETFDAALRTIGYKGNEPAAPFPVHAAFELHIEQGPILEQEALQIGVVTGVQAMRWYDLTVTGTPCHAGTTPMDVRRDPAATLARVMATYFDEIDSLAPDARATFGVMHSEPTSRNTVPERVTISVDLRHPRDVVLDHMESRLRELAAREADIRRTEATLERIWTSPSVSFDQECVTAVRDAAQAFGFGCRDMVSGAGHDAVYVASVAPTSMIFVPCAGGLSHNEAESASPEDLAAGCDALLGAITRIDQRG